MPLYPPLIYRQTQFANVTSDTTTTSTSFVDLLTQSITVFTGAKLRIEATTCSSTQDVLFSRIHQFQILVDGAVPLGGTQSQFGTEVLALSLPATCGIVLVTGVLTEGAHTIKLQWKVNGSTGQIRASTGSNAEHGSLLIAEVGN